MCLIDCFLREVSLKEVYVSWRQFLEDMFICLGDRFFGRVLGICILETVSWRNNCFVLQTGSMKEGYVSNRLFP